MKFSVLTIFPEVFPGPLRVGVVGRALENQQISLEATDLRDFTSDRHRQVDDELFGGGAGMVFKPEPLVAAVRKYRADDPEARVMLMSPQGRRFDHRVAAELASESHLVLVCGRYQGVDQRAVEEIGEQLSVGDFILSGGEVAAMAVIESVARLLPGVVGSEASLAGETFEDDKFAPPLYTRPAEFEGRWVPEVLRSGDHAAITRWRQEQADILIKQYRKMAPTGD